jgi:hypothetical protein
MPAITVLLAALAAQEPAPLQHDQHAHHGEQASGAKPEGGVAALEAERNASGTAWQPAGTPHPAWHLGTGPWTLMLHGLVFAGYDWQIGPRGDEAALLAGWLMAMARRDGATSSLVLRTMLSPEPWTVRDGGYPLLLQTGETYRGQPLHDRQHPHDLLMELAVLYTQEVVPAVAVQGYAALAGEPALGPVAYPHRLSAMADPLAPLGHHWLDSTHVSFGVLTLGITSRLVKIEGSWFNGREPDERRWDVDLRRPDSWSARLWLAPAEGVVAQISYAHMPSPHSSGHHHGGMDRATASLTHHLALSGGGHAATLLAWGLNRAGTSQNAVLAESTLALDGANVVFARGEYVRKSGHELVLPAPLDDGAYDILGVAAGYLRNFGPVAGLLPGIGLRLSGAYVPSSLGPAYGGRRFPLGAMLYVRLLPGARPR